jgi:flagellar biosynthetic protein FliQ
MAPEYVLDTARQALEIMLMVSLPLLGVALTVGLVVSVVQAVTQINETTLSFLPKLLALGIAFVIAGPWILSVLTTYIRRVLESIPAAVLG